MAERSVAVEVKIKGMKWEDFNDNEYIENLVNELKENGQNVVVGKFDELINWGRSNSLWPLTFATSCCGIEFISLGAARYDMARFGFEVARSSPRQADFMMVAGTIVHRMAPVFRRLYEQVVARFRADRLKTPTTWLLVLTRLFRWMSTSRDVLLVRKRCSTA